MPRSLPDSTTLARLAPMLLTERKTFPAGTEWSWEIKYDGYRMLASTGPASQLRTRNGANATSWFPEIVSALRQLPDGLILDGEICVLDDIGRSDFERVHARARRRRWYAGADPTTFCVFDILAGPGGLLLDSALELRRKALARALRTPRAGILHVTATPDGRWLYEQALALGLEGVVGKRAGSIYQPGLRSADWIKVKRPGAVPAQRFER